MGYQALNYIRSDIVRYYGHYSGLLFIKAYLRNETFRWQVAFRLCSCGGRKVTTIGSHTTAAHIGDNVYIGPGVSVVGNINIGDNVTIGAGSVVTKDIPDNATAVGNYAKVINFNNPGRFVNNR